MAEPDFNIKRETVEVTRVAGNRTDATFNPPSGVNIAVAYIQPSAGNDAQVNTLLNQIEALCDGFGKKIWMTEALEDKRPQVEVRVIVRDDVEVE